MPDKKINEFAAATNAFVTNGNSLWAMGDPSTGKMYQATGEKVKNTFQTFKLKYIAEGGEGTTLTISELEGKEILMIAREGAVMYEVSEDPDTTEFIWNDTDIILGLEITGAGERFLILYKTK